MKKAFILTAVILSAVAASAQDYKFIYYLDENFASVDSATARFVGKGYNDNGLFAVDGFDKSNGQLFLKAHFVDSTLSNMQGKFQNFYPGGKIQSEGNYQNSMEQGLWTGWDSTGLKTDSIIYDKGKEVSGGTYIYYKNGIPRSFAGFDSTARTKLYIFFDSAGVKTSEINITGITGTRTAYDSNGRAVVTPLTSIKLEEAHFPGGDAAFHKYLERNLNAMTPGDHNAPSGMYTIMVKFEVDKDGTISNVFPETNFGYGMEDEAVRIIKKSPNWVPAQEFGVVVRAYRRQPITFVVDNGDGKASRRH